ncbi:MAG: hypothetical protein WC455_21620 [Dehalococcoidia bacterium]
MRIDYRQCEPGCILVHKRGHIFSVSGILSRLLKLFDKNYDGYGWHMSIAWKQEWNGWWILEATTDGVECNFYHTEYLFEDTRVYKWFDGLNARDMADFFHEYKSKIYDRLVYFWTGLAIILRRFWGIEMVHPDDDKFTCWELTAEFTEEMNKPILKDYEMVIISDMVKKLGE